MDFVESGAAAFSAPATAQVSARGRRGHNAGRALSAPSQPAAETPHKVRGPNWTEAEMLVLIGQKRIEWDGRHNCNQPSLAKFVYGSTAWKLVLAGCMAVPGFRAWRKNLGNMTSALLMMASSMDALTRYAGRTKYCCFSAIVLPFEVYGCLPGCSAF